MKKIEKKAEKKTIKKENTMRNVEIEKVVLNCGGIGEKFEKSVKLLGLITGRKVKEIASKKRIPAFGLRPGLKTGCIVTLRGKDKDALLNKLLEAVDKKIKSSQIKENSFSFGIKEYLEIPGIEYQRDIGILGLDVTVVFKRKGKRVMLRKIKRGKIGKKQHVTKEEIINFLRNKFEIETQEKEK